MTAPNYQVKKIQNSLKPYKVYPKDIPSWEDNKDENFFFTLKEAQTEADERNNMFNMIVMPEQD